jgi:hypothetical protein
MSKVKHSILRIKKCKYEGLKAAYKHNYRLIHVINADQTFNIEDIVADPVLEALVHSDKKTANGERTETDYLLGRLDTTTLCALVDQKLKQKNVTRVRKDSVFAIEIVLTASPGTFSQDENEHFNYKSNCNRELLENWKAASLDWLKNEFGDNFIRAQFHLDEKTPHLHAFVVPIMPKKKSKEDNSKENSANEFTLAASRLMKPDWFVRLHDDYAAAVQHLGLVRGVQRSIKASHLKNQTYGELVAEIDVMQRKLTRLHEKHQDELGIYQASIDKLQAESASLQQLNRDDELMAKSTEKRLQALENDLAQKLSEIKKLREGYVQESQKYKDKIEDIKLAEDKAKEQEEIHNTEIAQATNTLAELKIEMSKVADHFADTQFECFEKQDEVSTLKENITELQTIRSLLTQKIAAAKSILVHQKANIDKASKVTRELQLECSEWTNYQDEFVSHIHNRVGSHIAFVRTIERHANLFSEKAYNLQDILGATPEFKRLNMTLKDEVQQMIGAIKEFQRVQTSASSVAGGIEERIQRHLPLSSLRNPEPSEKDGANRKRLL